MIDPHQRTIAVLGLGYVGLPVACAFAAQGFEVIGFDIDSQRIQELQRGHDRTSEVEPPALQQPTLRLSADPGALASADFYIVTVPTPISADLTPNLEPLERVSAMLGAVLKPGAIVVYESTVYPGVTEEICAPILSARSGLTLNQDFAVGYSPERINPGDKQHTFESITKVVAASNPEALAWVEAVYGAVVRAGIHTSPSIKVAEAAKVIENTQRDLNIALMNELAMICDKLSISTKDVLEAAGTKWNFMPFAPGLVGGHCIGVDPYYLVHCAEQLGHKPDVLLAGRRINQMMSANVAHKLLALLGGSSKGARVTILGLTFKENIPDIRNSRIPDMIEVLKEHNVAVAVHDPWVDPEQSQAAYGLDSCPWEALTPADALVLAVPHACFLEDRVRLAGLVKPGGVVVDIKSVLSHPWAEKASVRLWQL